jgi:hypothetical protein
MANTIVAANAGYYRFEIALQGNHPPTANEIRDSAQPVVAWEFENGVCRPITPAPRAVEKQICATLCPSGIVVQISENGQASTFKNFDTWFVALCKQWNAAKAAKRAA